MAKTKRPSTSTRAGRHPYDITLERQPGETDAAWAALISDLEPANIVTRVSDNSIGLRRRMAGATP